MSQNSVKRSELQSSENKEHFNKKSNFLSHVWKHNNENAVEH